MDCIIRQSLFYEQPIVDYIREAKYTDFVVINDSCQNDDGSTIHKKSVNDSTQMNAAFSGDDIISYDKYGVLRYVKLLLRFRLIIYIKNNFSF